MAGVGGQGILRASDILCRVFMAAGLDVKKSEVHGMAQRGGCVTSHVRYGAKVYSPLAKKNDVDILVSFEKMDTLRYLDYVKEEGTVIINTKKSILLPSIWGKRLIRQMSLRWLNGYFRRSSGRCHGSGHSGGEYPRRQYGPFGTLSSCLPLSIEMWEKGFRSHSLPDFLRSTGRPSILEGQSKTVSSP